MGEVVHNKLVRDNIPAIIEADGHEPVTRVLGDEEYRYQLLTKLIEEATELRDSNGSLGERVDVEEVVRALDDVLGYSPETIEDARRAKAEQRGVFASRIFLEKVIKQN